MDKGVIIMKNKISLRKIRIQCAMKTYSTIKKNASFTTQYIPSSKRYFI